MTISTKLRELMGKSFQIALLCKSGEEIIWKMLHWMLFFVGFGLLIAGGALLSLARQNPHKREVGLLQGYID